MQSNEIIVLSTLTIILASTIGLLIYLGKEHAPIRTTVVQTIGVMLFVPLLFLLSFTGKIGENTVATLLGAFVGYLFGKRSLVEEWGGHQEYKKTLK